MNDGNLSFEAVESKLGLPPAEPTIPETEPARRDGIDIVPYIKSGPEFCSVERPERETIFGPFIKDGDRVIIAAKAGTGKTWLALGLCRAVATGSNFFEGETGDSWAAPKPRSVLYIDGEMDGRDLSFRLRELGLHECPNFHVFSVGEDDLPMECRALNFASEEYQNAVISAIEETDASLLVIDNVACLYRPFTENGNSAESWRPMLDFLVRRLPAVELRDGARPAALLIDHHGKGEGSGPRGTSAKVDQLTAVLALSKGSGEGTVINVEFTKSRSFFDDDAEPLAVKLKNGTFTRCEFTEPDETPRRKKASPKRDLARSLLLTGHSVEDVTRQGISKSVVYQVKNELEAEKEAEGDEANDELDTLFRD